MRKILNLNLLVIFPAIIIFSFFSGEAFSNSKPRLAVRTFEDKTEDQKAPANAVMDMMITEINKSGIFDLMEREKLNYIADEIELSQSGLMDPETAPQLGKIKGVQYTMTGAITLYYFNEKKSGITLPVIKSTALSKTAYVLLEIRIFDNSTGQIIYASDQLGTATQKTRGNPNPKEQLIFSGGYQTVYSGILAQATRDAVIKHVQEIKNRDWE